MLRPEAGGGKAGAGGLKAATHENLHIFATHVRAVRHSPVTLLSAAEAPLSESRQGGNVFVRKLVAALSTRITVTARV